MITYENQNRPPWCVDVRLDGKIVGAIVSLRDGWAYRPKGARKTGDIFPSLAAVKASIEGTIP